MQRYQDAILPTGNFFISYLISSGVKVSRNTPECHSAGPKI